MSGPGWTTQNQAQQVQVGPRKTKLKMKKRNNKGTGLLSPACRTGELVSLVYIRGEASHQCHYGR